MSSSLVRRRTTAAEIPNIRERRGSLPPAGFNPNVKRNTVAALDRINERRGTLLTTYTEDNG